MSRRRALAAAAAAIGVTAWVAGAGAQALGTFTWQVQPFCNVITVNITQQGGLYTADGFDDQCSAAQRAPLVGVVTPNPDGTIGIGLHVVTVPGGRGLDIEARLALASLSGPWTDSAGNSGTLAFGQHASGSPRPVPSGGPAPGSVTNVSLAPGAVTSASVADGSLTTADLAAPTRLAWSGLTAAPVRLTTASTVIRSVTLQVPASGQVLVNASGLFTFRPSAIIPLLGGIAWCSISTGTSVEASQYLYAAQTRTLQTTGSFHVTDIPFAGTRVYAVAAGTFTVNLVCTSPDSQVDVYTAGLSALFVGN
ncbi:MAG: hypothetical protein R2745_18550 [Vicinamibacterales bacterium]